MRERNRERIIETPGFSYAGKGYQRLTATIVAARRGEGDGENMPAQ